jgi:hypothetical protein
MNRQEAQELLPWFVAGTLNEDESRAVQAFIDSGEISKAELNELTCLQTLSAARVNTSLHTIPLCWPRSWINWIRYPKVRRLSH